MCSKYEARGWLPSLLVIERIRAKSTHQTSLLIDRAQEAGFSIRSPEQAEHRGGAVTLDVPHGYEVTQALIAGDILVDFRQGAGIRIAPHFYNSDGEILSAIDAIVEILDTKSYLPYTRRGAVVT